MAKKLSLPEAYVQMRDAVNYAYEMLVTCGEDSKQFKAADKKADELKHLVNEIQLGLK